MTEAAVQVHRWHRAEWERLVEAGVFGPTERLELVDGEVVRLPPQNSAHSSVVTQVGDTIRAHVGSGSHVRVQVPLAIDQRSEPEPDLAVVEGQPRDYFSSHPRTALLVIEVSESTLDYDRGTKKRLYARNGIPEYWIVDLAGRCLEVYLDPQRDDYGTKITLRHGETVSPYFASSVAISVDELLP